MIVIIYILILTQFCAKNHINYLKYFIMHLITDLIDLYIDDMQNLYALKKTEWNELSNFILNVKSDQLKIILNSRKKQASKQLGRIAEALLLFGKMPVDGESKLIKIYFEETEKVLKTITERSVMEAKIIESFQIIAHIEIAIYGTLLSYANTMKISKLASLFENSLKEEKEFDLKLTIVAENKINADALIETFIPLN